MNIKKEIKSKFGTIKDFEVAAFGQQNNVTARWINNLENTIKKHNKKLALIGIEIIIMEKKNKCLGCWHYHETLISSCILGLHPNDCGAFKTKSEAIKEAREKYGLNKGTDIRDTQKDE